ncbi:PD-(D/E)XK nuclease family protein, partial [Enterococcus innesii]|uniref:PD-(D/E)XK nuclease family protein n=1 Tax=Enterococcus innesii TaxID=2839759 RepID=UPI003DA3D3A2
MISKADLKQSEVVFNELAHTYLRGDTELSGITGLIHAVLLLGVYPDASDYVKKVQIPKAGYYGTCVHKSIQTWDELGIEMTQFPEKEHPTAGILPAQDVSAELAYYRKVKPRKCKTIANEFTVDYGNFASQIDCVWGDEDGNIYLVDHKTNNLDYYPGGAAGLKEYLSWQLSCYAVMFEQQTGLKVNGLFGNWLRKGAGELWRIERKPDEQVQKLLSTEIHKQDWGGFTYYN